MNEESSYKFLQVFNQHSFLYNPRDQNRFLSLIIGEKQIDEEKKIKILKAFEAGTNSQYFQSKLAFEDEVKIITKIVSFKEKNGEIVAKFQNGFIGKFDPHLIANNPDDFYNLLQTLMFVKIRNKQIEDIYSIEPENNYEIAKELFEIADQENQLYALLLQSFGYDISRMEPTDILLTLPRLFSLFYSPISKRRINYIEISNRGTAKTTTFTILQEFFNYRYYTEAPTYANLVYDARNNMYGAVFLSNGLIFDEIQNWKEAKMKADVEIINSTLSTGLENCIWTRGAGAESNFAVVHKCLPIIYAGNPISYTLTGLQKYEIEEYLDQYKVFSYAILDRIHIIQLAVKKTYDKIVNGKVLYPSVLRALVELIQQKINKITDYIICDNFQSRRFEQSVDIQILLKALNIDLLPPDREKEEFCKQLEFYMRFSNLEGGVR
ncbi:ATPase domain [Sulfolobales Beppu rod-shaped virus 1]|uniref:ATPase domain n=1 Tax=Sulfolobales Beppu rod-shaped virus 1 TaxID=2493121 RepID=A0A3S8NF78_9VIRU|nr:ATPase domain [Sulfolobales Beppu rod-shaped virus 1]AZI75903.1 ATPase domain [Sulfolobales Beppu rod-shaped virus 1]